MLTDDLFSIYDLIFCMAKSTPDILQNAEMMSDFSAAILVLLMV